LTDSLLQSLIGNVLRAGVTAAAAIVLACGAWYLAESGGRTADYRTFRGTPYGQHLLASWVDPLALIQLGLFLLIATPVARVILSVAAFALERDRVYVAITTLVLAILLYSIATTWL